MLELNLRPSRMEANVTFEDESVCSHQFVLRADTIWIAFNRGYCIFGGFWLLLGVISWFCFSHLPYLKKRSLWVVVFLSISLAANLSTGACSRGFLDSPNFLTGCVWMNSTQALILLPFVSSQLVVLVVFHYQVLYNRKLSASFRKSSGLGHSGYDRKDDKLKKLKYLSSPKFGRNFSLGLLVLCFLLAIIFTLSTCPQMGLTTVCTINSVSSLASLMTGYLPIFFFGISLAYISRKTRTYPDPFNILYHSKWTFLYGLPLLFISMGTIIIDPGNFEETEEILGGNALYAFDWAILIDMSFLFLYFYNIHYQVYRAKKFDLMSVDDTYGLSTVLDHPVGREIFRQHLVSEFSVENLNFYEAVTAYQKLFSSVEKQGRSGSFSTTIPRNTGYNKLTVAKNIFSRYFSSATISEVNVSNDVMKRLQQRLDSTNSATDDIFNEAQGAVFFLMENDAFRRFQRTKEYEDFLGSGYVSTRFNSL